MNAKMTPARERFAQLVGSGVNQAEAYRQCYPSSVNWKPVSVHQKASHLAAEPIVAARIAEIQAGAAERAELDGAEILKEIRRLALSDIGGIMHADGKRVKLPHELDPATRAAIASFKIDEYGRIEYKFWDKNAALEKAAKIKGLYEVDNKQKADALGELLQGLSGNVMGPAPGAASPALKFREDDEADGDDD